MNKINNDHRSYMYECNFCNCNISLKILFVHSLGVTRQVRNITTLSARDAPGVTECSARDKRCFYRVRRYTAIS